MLMRSVEQLHFCAHPHTPALLALLCLSASFLFIVSSVEQLYLCASPHAAVMWGPVSQVGRSLFSLLLLQAYTQITIPSGS